MNIGKKICETLKEVRLRVAQANDIDYTPVECHHKGDCLGTCPRCEQEVRLIEEQLDLRRAMGKAVRLVGVSAGIAALSSCQLLFGGQENGHMVDPEYEGMQKIHEDQTDGYLAVDDDSTCQESTQQAPKSMVVQTDSSNQELKMVTMGEIVETPPQFQGGQRGLENFINEHLNAKAGGEEGKVVVSFTVEKDGTVSNPKVMKSLNAEADKEALRVVGLMPKWSPGGYAGERRAMNYSMPIKFKAN